MTTLPVAEVLHSLEEELTAARKRPSAEQGINLVERVVDVLNSHQANLVVGDSRISKDQTLVVLQREAAAISNQVPGITHIASIDATSCVIVGFRTSQQTVITHLDSPGSASTRCMQRMLDSCGEGDPVDVYLLGGCGSVKHAIPTLIEVLVFLNDHCGRMQLRLDGCCIWTMNVDPATKKCRYRGIAVNTMTGTPSPFELLRSDRQKYPEGHLRTLAVFGEDREIRWITATSEEAKKIRDVLKEEMEEEHSFCIRIGKFSWKPFPPHVVRFSREQIMDWSTTPELEPDDFPEVMKGALIYANSYSVDDVFRTPAILYRYSPEGSCWCKL